MKIVEKHLHKQSFKQTPLKWLIACCLIPVHFAEMYYKKRYHLTYVHAKKLFIFDIGLLLSIVVLSITSLIWFLYQPNPLEYLTVTVNTHDKIISGQKVVYETVLTNTTDQVLTDITIIYKAPEGFVADDTSPKHITELTSKQNYTHSLSGFLYGEPDKEYRFVSYISYTVKETNERHVAVATHLTTLRDSVISLHIKTPELISQKGTYPFTLDITNNGDSPVQVVVPLAQEFHTVISLDPNDVVHQEISRSIQPHQTISYTGVYQVSLNKNINEISQTYTSSVIVNKIQIPQTSQIKKITVAHPNMATFATWQKKGPLTPGAVESLKVILQNTGDLAINSPIFTIELDQHTIDIARAKKQYPGKIKNNVLTLSYDQTIAPQKEQEYTIHLPILAIVSPQYLTTDMSGTATVTVSNVAGVYYSAPITIYTKEIYKETRLDGYALYYTPDGDQLGRGPLPPQVDKQTNYLVITQLRTGSEALSDIRISGTIPQNIVWTGKTSSNYNNNFEQINQALQWKATSLPANAVISLTFELGFTPTIDQIGAIQQLVGPLSFYGVEARTGKEVSLSIGAITTALPRDSIAQEKGTAIK